MSEPFIGQIILFGGTFPPLNWATCNGQLLSIANYSPLFNLLGTTYGGDGTNTFGVPDLRSRVPICMGQGQGRLSYVLGQTGGTENVTLTAATIAGHSHALNIVTSAATLNVPSNTAVLATEGGADAAQAFTYSPYNASQGALAGNSISASASGNQPHSNIEPFIAMNYIIALYGTYPTQA